MKVNFCDISLLNVLSIRILSAYEKEGFSSFLQHQKYNKIELTKHVSHDSKFIRISRTFSVIVRFIFPSDDFLMHVCRHKQQVTTPVCVLILQPGKIQENMLLLQRTIMARTQQTLKLWWWTSLVFPRDHFHTPTPHKIVCHLHGTHHQMMGVEILQVSV